MTGATLLSLIIGVFVGTAAGYLGSVMILERMALVGDALSHVALPGLAIGILLNFNPFIGAFAFLFASAVLVWYVQRMTKLPFETIVGATFTLALAVGIVIIPEPELLEALFGDITKVTLSDTLAAVAISVGTVLVTKMIYHKLVLGIISEDIAISKGINTAKVNLLYLFLVSIIVAVGIKIVGTLLVGFLVVVPAAAARNLSVNLTRYATLSMIFGAGSAFIGILLSSLFELPTGPMVVFVGVAFFAMSIIARATAK